MKKVVIIGLGSIARRHIMNVKILYPNSKIFAVSSSGQIPEIVSEHIDEIGIDIKQAIYFNPDFAIVASPATFHFQHSKQLLAANIPTLIEKPVTADSQEARELITFSNQMKVPVCVGYCLRYLPAANIVKNTIKENQLGYIYNVSTHVGQYLPEWRKDKDYRSSVSSSAKLGGGALLELSHELDYLYWFFGELQYKYAVLRHTKELNLEVEEIADIVLSTSNGTICTVHLNFIQKKRNVFVALLVKKVLFTGIYLKIVSL